jgi:hypothetical protein
VLRMRKELLEGAVSKDGRRRKRRNFIGNGRGSCGRRGGSGSWSETVWGRRGRCTRPHLRRHALRAFARRL